MQVASLLPLETTLLSGPSIRPERTDTTWIYFLGVNDSRIKIGHSRQPRGKRLADHLRGSLGMTAKVDELCEVRGKKADETTVHKYFAESLVAGQKELFEATSDLVDYVRWLRDQWWVSVPQLSDTERDALPVVDATTWLPTPERRKAPPPQPVLPLFQGQELEQRRLFDFAERTITGDDFYTNKIIIDAARSLMGGIDLDPASHAIANKVVQATRFFCQAENGLEHQWAGRVWVNPPFSAWKAWAPKITSEWNSGRISEMCVLSAMRTVTAQYFADFLAECDAICIIRGRIKFWGGVAGDSPDDGHAIYYFGTRREQFRSEFENLGTVFYGVTQ